MTSQAASRADIDAVDSTYAWIRLFVALVLGTIGSVGMWSYVVALPPVQADFGILRNAASMPYTMAMIGFAFGGVAMGRLADRYGIVFPAIARNRAARRSAIVAAGYAPNIWLLDAAHVLIGFGTSATFGPIVSDMSHWFRKRRGIAIGIASCGNYARARCGRRSSSTSSTSDGWRTTHIGVGIFCVVTMMPLALMMRRPSPVETRAGRHGAGAARHARTEARTPCRRCWRSPASPAASRWRCRRCISSPIAPTSVTAWRAAPRCSR